MSLVRSEHGNDFESPRNIIVILGVFLFAILISVLKFVAKKFMKVKNTISINNLGSSYRDNGYIKEADVRSYLELKL